MFYFKLLIKFNKCKLIIMKDYNIKHIFIRIQYIHNGLILLLILKL